MFADFLSGHFSTKKLQIFKKYWKTTIQESCTKKYNFAPGATNHPFFDSPCIFSINFKIIINIIEIFDKYYGEYNIYINVINHSQNFIPKIYFYTGPYNTRARAFAINSLPINSLPINSLPINSLAIKITLYKPPVLYKYLQSNSFTINSFAITFFCYPASTAINFCYQD